jgi:hypothetical protein
MRSLVVCAAVLTLSASAAGSETLYCSTSFQGYRVCQGPSGYTSTEWSRDGMRFGQDSQGHRWTSSRWQGFTTTTVTPPDR